MAYTTQLQQVIQYLKQGGKIKPPAGAAGASQPSPAPAALPFGNKPSEAGKPVGRMPSGPPPKMSK
jgi:hypothetical protein